MKRHLLAFLLCAACGTGVIGDDQAPDASTPQASVCPYNIRRHNPNSWLLQPNVKFVFLGDYWNTSDDEWAYVEAWNVLLNVDGNVLDRLAEYGIRGGTFVDYPAQISIPAGFSSPLPDLEIPTLLNTAFREGDIGVPADPNDFYVVFLPPGVWTANMLTWNAGGYHATAYYGSTQYVYAIIGPHDPDTNREITSHEIYEGSTNPTGDGWWDDVTGEEIADICVYIPETLDDYVVQKVWSQDSCRCQ